MYCNSVVHVWQTCCAIQHLTTYCNRVAKRVEHVVHNNIVISYVDMLGAFGQTITYVVFRKSVSEKCKETNS